MDAETEWYPRKNWIVGWIIERRECSNFAGSFYKLARDARGDVMYFWTLKGAQEAANALNAEPTP